MLCTIWTSHRIAHHQASPSMWCYSTKSILVKWVNDVHVFLFFNFSCLFFAWCGPFEFKLICAVIIINKSRGYVLVSASYAHRTPHSPPPHILVCLCQVTTWISNAICFFFFCVLSDLMWEVNFRFSLMVELLIITVLIFSLTQTD